MCDVNKHQWEETYYGLTCTVCGLLVPDGLGWWMPLDSEPSHTGFYIQTEHGSVHVLGDPNMDAETKEALTEMVRCAQEAIKSGKLGKKQGE